MGPMLAPKNTRMTAKNKKPRDSALNVVPTRSDRRTGAATFHAVAASP